jgi:hypothetical protein
LIGLIGVYMGVGRSKKKLMRRTEREDIGIEAV